MPEYLVIGGAGESAVNALAVAADLVNHTSGAQADIAVPLAHKEIAELSNNVRRVVGFEIASSPVPDISLGAFKEAAGGGWKNMLSAARGKVKEAAESAAENYGQYKILREELHLARYDVVFDLQADAGSVIVARCAESVRVVGFATDNIPNAPPGLTLLYHDNYPAPKSIPRRQQCRTLAARALGYEFSPQPEWNFKPVSPPASAPNSPFILLGGNVPEPFAKILTDAGLPLVGGANGAGGAEDSAAAEFTPGELLALAGAASCVAGGGLAAALGTATGTPVMFIGGKEHMPPNAVLTDSPAALKEALDGILRAHQPAPPPPEETTAPESAAPESPKEPNSPAGAEESAAAEAAKESPPKEKKEEKKGSTGLRLRKD